MAAGVMFDLVTHYSFVALLVLAFAVGVPCAVYDSRRARRRRRYVRRVR